MKIAYSEHGKAKMKYSECVILWNSPENGVVGEILVAARPLGNIDEEKYSSSGGGDFTYTHCLTEIGSIVDVQAEFISMILQDGLDPKMVDDEFMKIDEYAITRRYDFYGVLGKASPWPEAYWDAFVEPSCRDQLAVLMGNQED
jgi:hypothetical protein